MPTAVPTVNEHRADRSVVYPVISRRSGGLSVGIDPFPGEKVCSFDCPYCEVFPFKTDTRFSLGAMEGELRAALSDALRRGIEVKDICFSGSGEPTLLADLAPALEAASRLRDELVPDASLVLITNGSTLADASIKETLRRAIGPRAEGGADLDLWVKLDAGTSSWYEKIDRGMMPFEELIAALESFIASSPVTIQTMLCAVGGLPPPEGEVEAWIALALRLARTGNVRRFHLYGKARPAPEDPATEALALHVLEARASALGAALSGEGLAVPIAVFP